jgi:hypothetical protein
MHICWQRAELGSGQLGKFDLVGVEPNKAYISTSIAATCLMGIPLVVNCIVLLLTDHRVYLPCHNSAFIHYRFLSDRQIRHLLVTSKYRKVRPTSSKR